MVNLLDMLSALGVRLDVRDGKLQASAPAGVLTRELRQAIDRQRDDLIEKLLSARGGDTFEPLPQIVPNPAARHQPFPLTDVQHAYWVGRSSQIDFGSVSTHIYFELECEPLDPARLGEAFRRVVALHDMLRAVIDVNGEQRVLERLPDYEMEVCDLRGAEGRHREAELLRIREEMSQQTFDAGRWPLFDLRLIQVDADRSRLCVSWDFLMVDAWSLILIFQHWYAWYQDSGCRIDPPSLSFRDYVLAAARLKELPSYRTSRQYWWDRIDALPLAPLLPVHHRVERGRKQRFERRQFRLAAREWDEVKARARMLGLTPTSLLLAAFSEVLNRWAKVPHYCLNLTLFNRQPLHEEVGAIVGDFTTLLALEVDARDPASFIERATRLQAQFLRDFDHRQVSAVEVLRECAKRRGLQQQAILPVVFTSTLMLDGRRSADSGGLEQFGKMAYGTSQTPQVWLDYQVFEVNGELVIKWDAVDQVFLPGVLDDMFEAHQMLVESLARSGEAWERQNPVRLPAAQAHRRVTANETTAEVVDCCLQTLVVERALQQPDRVAVAHAGGDMTYGELLARSARVSEELLQRGVRPNELVAIVMHAGWEQIVAVLGVLISGAAYLPIDPRWPTLRRDHLMRHGEVRIALTQRRLNEQIEWPSSVERLEIPDPVDLNDLASPPPVRQSTGDLAYVIFTSGSTGTPKGVMIDHRGAVNTVVHVNRLFGVNEHDSALAVSDLTFDLSVYDIFGLLAAGGTIVIPDPGLSRDPGHWEDLIRCRRVTLWNSAPQLMGMLVDALEARSAPDIESVRLVLLSGDWIPVSLPDRIRRFSREARVVSLGGATEGSIWSIYYPVEKVSPDWESIPYGKALPNQHMYVLDKTLQPCPDLVAGNIYIGGHGVALGYWKDPERTSRQFLVHPATGERLYFTGDLGRVRRDGNIEFLGREDSQVKLRGHRVELGEIAASIQLHPDIRDAVVRVVKEGERSTLAAYVVAEEREGSPLFERVDVSPDTGRSSTAAIRQAADRHAAAADRRALQMFSSFWRQVERAALRSMLETLQALGLTDGTDAAARLDYLVREGCVLPQYRRLTERWLQVLADAGHLVTRDGGYTVARTDISTGDSVDQQLAAVEQAYGDDERLSGMLQHFASCVRNQLLLLRGEVAPLSLLFPQGSWHVAEALYESNPVVRHHNGVLAAAVRALVTGWDSERSLRVLEIGAGTGGTSASLLPHLPASRTDYWYTDVSSYFFAAAQEKFGGYPFVRYAVFDINKAPGTQGHQPHTYDLIVAANVLHNAEDTRQALGRVRELLRPGGYLLMLEGTRTTPWMWTTVGYLDLVHGYADERADSGEPAMSADLWSRALSDSGFEAVQVFPPAGAPEHDELASLLAALPQHVLLAQGPASASRFRGEALAAFLRERLPDYMVPQQYLLLEQLPLSANGKVDLAALPSDVAHRRVTERAVVIPGSDTEAHILRIWRKVLGVEELSVTDNFFEVGGDSLLITEVLRTLNQSRQTPLTVAELFAAPTIRSLAAYLDQSPDPSQATAPVIRDRPRHRADQSNAAIAIIGMAGRFPDARNVEELWQNLLAGRCAVRRFSDEELLEAGVGIEELTQDGYVRAGVVLEDIDLFDASYFGLTPREAEVMDPQQRFLLECSVEALENAGYANEGHAGRIGVFVGKGTSLYFLQHVLSHPDLLSTLGLMHILNVNEKDYTSTLVSYKLNLTGPSVNINTACSTSLVAVHSACQSLLAGECDIALSGGVSFVSTAAKSGYVYQEGEIFSPDGLCRAFSDDANGTVFGSGIGLVVLKPLAAALRDGDYVHAVIQGTAINNDGSLKVSFSAPNLHGQAEVIALAQERAGVSPDTIQMLEAHGTGTTLGDPIEFSALQRVFGGPRRDGSRCALGSVKSNIGHLDAAAGIAGLIKTVEALKHRTIPPTLHSPVPTRKVDFTRSPFYLNSEPVEWTAGTEPRRAGVSSFGVGGTNAHLVVEEAPAVAARRPSGRLQLLPLSAKSPDSLRRIAQELAANLDRRPELSLDDVAFTLQVGRNAHPYRTYVVCDQLADARHVFEEREHLPVANRVDGRSVSVAFLFPGQGSQQRDVTWTLYQTQPRFRSVFDTCAAVVQQHTGEDLRDWLYTAWRKDAAAGDGRVQLDQTAFTQPVLFAVEYALAQFWQSLGVRPAAMLGHSLGEYVAACLAGVFSFEEALSLVVVRGRLLQSLEPGRMLAVTCSEAQLRELLPGGCSLAAVNGPKQCVASGPIPEIETLQRRLQAAAIPSVALRTSHAFHSQMVEPILDTFERCVAEVRRNPPSIPFISNISGTWITEEQATSPAYWARHLREPVRFADGMRTLSSIGNPILLEVGPGHTLTSLVSRADPTARPIPTLGLGTGQDEAKAVLDAIGRLWSLGVDIDWAPLHEGSPRGRVPLPTYAFERTRHWLDRRTGMVPVRSSESTGAVEASRSNGNNETLNSYRRPELQTEYVAPGNEIEEKLVGMWRTYLGIDRIGVHDSFFEFGGDSLIATRIHAQIRREFGVELPLGKMFEFDTVRRIYLYIRVSQDPSAIDTLTAEELDDCLAILDS